MALQNIEANITLDLYNHDTTPSTVKAIQLDSQTRYVAAMLQSGGVQYDVDSGATVQLIVVRPDKVGVQITGETFTYGDEGAQFLGPYAELTQVALAVSGKMRGQFKITSGTQILRTEIFAISNGEALDASTDEWADEYDGYNLEEMATSIETNTADIATLEADVSQIKEEFSDLEGEFSKTPSVKNVTENDAELYICDANGKVLAKFAEGGFQTEKFNTSDLPDLSDLSDMAFKKNTTTSADLDITDAEGGVVLRLADGHIKTKNFDSADLASVINGISKNTDTLDDVVNYSLDNRLANPIYTTNELYNEENPSNPITPVNALYRNMDSFATNGYRIPTIVITNSGTVLVAAQHMKSAGGDFGDFGIHVARKTVDGEWTASEVIPFDTTRQDYGGCLNPEFLVDRTSERIYLFYGTEKQKVVWWEVTTEDGDFRYVYSDDDGESWSNPVSLKSLWDTEEYDYCIPSCTKGITLTNGTLVVPCFCKKGFDGSTAYSYPLILYKTVNGDWKFSRVVKTDIKHLDECAVVEGTSANSIWLYCRPNTNYGTGVNRGYNKFVYNINADTFTKIPTTFDTNRHNCFGIDRITIDGTVIYLMTFTDSNSLKRDNITLWASLDGDIWIRVYRILKQSGNGYSVIDNYNGQIWVAYESGDSIAVQDVSVLSSLISETASKYIVRNITVQDRMQMIYNALRGIN